MVKEDFFFIIVPTAAGKADIQTLWQLSTIPIFLNKRLFPIIYFIIKYYYFILIGVI